LSVKRYLLDKIKKYGSIHLSLIDPEEIKNNEMLKDLINIVNRSGSHGIMVGGSTLYDKEMMDDTIKIIKSHTSLPVIIFPNDITSISQYADAIWFMSLLNSLNPYYISGAQMRAAPVIYKVGIEPLSLAYVIVGEGKTVGYMGYAHPIPYDEPMIVVGYCLAAEYMGFDFIYLEAGSGASRFVREDLVSLVKKYTSRTKLVVGGGIRSYEDAFRLSKAGADIIVTGTILEENPEVLVDIVRGVKDGGKYRLSDVQRTDR